MLKVDFWLFVGLTPIHNAPNVWRLMLVMSHMHIQSGQKAFCQLSIKDHPNAMMFKTTKIGMLYKIAVCQLRCYDGQNAGFVNQWSFQCYVQDIQVNDQKVKWRLDPVF